MQPVFVCVRVCACACVCVCVHVSARVGVFFPGGVKNEGDITGARVVFDPRCLKTGGVHSTSWKFGLCFACILIVDWNFLTKFFNSDSCNVMNVVALFFLEIISGVQLLGIILEMSTFVPAKNFRFGRNRLSRRSVCNL